MIYFEAEAKVSNRPKAAVRQQQGRSGKVNRSLFVAGALLIGANAMACEISTFEQLAAESPYGVTIASVDVVVDGPGHCRVEGMIANAENGQSRIRFRLSLPDAASWNGKYLVVGNAGTAGSFQNEARARMGLQLGYATGQTDTGHTRQGAEDWLMKETATGEMGPNHTAIQDFAHRAIHLTNVVGEQLINGFYATAPEQKYYFGCSTGGRQGLAAMQRYPSDFDGIIAGAPVFSLPRLNMSQLWAAQQVAALEADRELLSADQLNLLRDSAVAACDADDGVADQIIDNPRQCGVEPEALLCAGSESPPACLTDAQVDFVSTIYEGPISAAGERIYPGRMPGSEGPVGMGAMGGWSDLLTPNCANDTGTTRCGLVSRAWYSNPDEDVLNDFSIDDPEDVAFADSSYYSRAVRADNPDVTPFVQRGGKAILYHGWADTSVTPITTIKFYEAMEDTVSRKRGEEDFTDHVRLFLGPGMGHCGGGVGPNNYALAVLEAIDAWVEEGRAPDSIVVSHDQRNMTRPWCPYPQVARLKEPGLDSNEAENFVCVNP